MKNYLLPLALAAHLSTSQASAIATTKHAQPNSDLICNQKGWDTGHLSFLHIEYTNSYAYCAGVCALYPQCKSFTYFLGTNPGVGGDCELYDVPVRGNFHANEGSPFMFYDVGCAAQMKWCDVKGYSKINAYTVMNTQDAATCLARCDDYGTFCQSYAFAASTRECLLYSELTATNVLLNSDSPYVFNDHICGGISSTTAPPAYTMTSTTTRTTASLSFTTSVKTTASTTSSSKIVTTTGKAAAPTTTMIVSTTANKTTSTVSKVASTTAAPVGWGTY